MNPKDLPQPNIYPKLTTAPIATNITVSHPSHRESPITFAVKSKAAGSKTITPNAPNWTNGHESQVTTRTSRNTLDQTREIKQVATNPRIGQLMSEGRLSPIKHSESQIVSHVVLPGHEFRSRRGAERVGKTVGKTHATSSQLVQIGCLARLATIHRQSFVAHVIGHNQDDIRS